MKLTRNTVSIRLLLFLAIFVLLNLLAYRWYFRLDFTADKRYTLSKVTKNVLKDLDEPITISAYFSEKLPPNLARYRNDLRDLLDEYQNYAGSNLVYEMIDPNKDEETERMTQQQGLPPADITIRERDEAKALRVYMGLVMKKGGNQEVVNLIQHIFGSRGGEPKPFEYPLTTALKKLTIKEKAKVGFIQGHGEPDMERISQAIQELSTLYEADTLTLDDPDRWAAYKTLVILAPSDSFPASHLALLDQFLSSGGRLFVGINAIGGELNAPQWNRIDTGLETWLAGKGISIESTFLTDVNSASINVQRQQGMFVMNTPMKFFYFPIIQKFEEHPITQGLEAVQFFFASPVSVMSSDSSMRSGVLAYTSGQTGKVPPPTRLDIERKWTEADFSYGEQPVGIFAEGKFGNTATESKIVVFGDGDFPLNQGNQQAAPNNLNLLVNSIDWLTDDTGLIELRTRGVESRRIEKLLGEDNAGKRQTFKILVFLIPILIAVIFGIIRFQLRRARRTQWKEKDYS